MQLGMINRCRLQEWVVMNGLLQLFGCFQENRNFKTEVARKPFPGENHTMDWEAKRVKETADVGGSASVTGDWKYDLTLDGGNVLNLVLSLKQDGDQVTGKVVVGDERHSGCRHDALECKRAEE